jgi:hypothetical protein
MVLISSLRSWDVASSVLLCYIYLAMLHYKACTCIWRQRAADIAVGVFGVVVTLYTTIRPIFCGCGETLLYCVIRRFVNSGSLNYCR